MTHAARIGCSLQVAKNQLRRMKAEREDAAQIASQARLVAQLKADLAREESR